MAVVIDVEYEFRAPRYYDFMAEETAEEIRAAEIWFDLSPGNAPSPFAPRVKEGRTIEIEALCDFSSVGATENVVAMAIEEPSAIVDASEQEDTPMEIVQPNELENDGNKCPFEFAGKTKPLDGHEPAGLSAKGNVSSLGVHAAENSNPSFEFPVHHPSDETTVHESSSPAICQPPSKKTVPASLKAHTYNKECTPKMTKVGDMTSLKPSTLKQATKSMAKKSPKSTNIKSAIKGRIGLVAGKSVTFDVAQENQPIKKQKLDNGSSRQILNVKHVVLPHKPREAFVGSANLISSTIKNDEEAGNQSKEVAPYISAAELVRRFESGTRDLNIIPNKPQVDAISQQRKPRLVLTRPKEPELHTAQRARVVMVKSTAELEAEMLAKIPKFKARPFNKKIAEAPQFLAIPRSTPQLPEFQEFHLKTMERAARNADICSEVSSVEGQNERKPLKLTQPRQPQLETSLRARPPRAKSTQEIEQEEIEKMPKFKARPLNKKILERKGDVGLPTVDKSHITIPHIFHFATDERFGPLTTVGEQFDKLSIHSDTSRCSKQEMPRLTVPNPFYLHTEERGAEKEMQLKVHIMKKQEEEEKARVPKAKPYPFTTDYPVVPSKPEPKPCTRPEGFQLESLVRHEEEMQKKMEEKERMEREEAQRRIFRAQPILKEDPIPLPERERIPLTEVQEFPLHIDQRAVQRSEFDKKIKEKELAYKRVREENEMAQKHEEEKALKMLRMTMVPHAKPLPKFDHPFHPQKSTKPPTKPKSPQLLVKQRSSRKNAFLR